MDDRHRERIRQQYGRKGADHVHLLRTVLAVAQEVGIDRALALLEEAVTEKRLSWLEQHLPGLTRTGDPVADGYRIFYQRYLGLSIPADGDLVEATGERVVMRWWNACPTLEACVALGLDTGQVCRQAYHAPVQAFLERIDPGLRFDRNYDALRPYAPYCEEIIWRDGCAPIPHPGGGDRVLLAGDNPP